ncbi:MAG: hypothetical protein ACRDKZ_12400 [Actinomycetota bacterium]
MGEGHMTFHNLTRWQMLWWRIRWFLRWRRRAPLPPGEGPEGPGDPSGDRFPRRPAPPGGASAIGWAPESDDPAVEDSVAFEPRR